MSDTFFHVCMALLAIVDGPSLLNLPDFFCSAAFFLSVEVFPRSLYAMLVNVCVSVRGVCMRAVVVCVLRWTAVAFVLTSKNEHEQWSVLRDTHPIQDAPIHDASKATTSYCVTIPSLPFLRTSRLPPCGDCVWCRGCVPQRSRCHQTCMDLVRWILERVSASQNLFYTLIFSLSFLYNISCRPGLH